MKKINEMYKNFKKLKLKKSIVALFFIVLSLLTTSINYVFIPLIILALLFSVMGLLDKQKLSYITTFLSVVFLVLYIFLEISFKDPNANDNVLIGTWIYNDNGGAYIFKEDFTYYQYVNSERDDNYCKGKYSYEYGYETDAGKMIRKDIDYIYYTLILESNECVINSKKDDAPIGKKQKKMVFGYGILDSSKSVILNTNTNLFSKLSKVKE